MSYDNLSRCQRGEVVFGHVKGLISRIGLVGTVAITAQKPPEFGSTGENRSQEGWLVRMNWQPLRPTASAAAFLQQP